MKINLLLVIILSMAGSISAENIDVYLIGGQSNATGQGYMRNIPVSFQIDKTVMFYHSRFLNQGEGAECWQPLCQASETRDKFGVELSLGTRLQSLYPDHRIALIKHGLSGSNLYAQWNPGNRSGENQGEEYEKFIETVKKGIEGLKEKGYNPVIKAMVWQQGEADARDIAGMENSRRYAENLTNFILQVRKELDCENMLFIYGTVIPIPAGRFTGREQIRTAQINIAEASGSDLAVRNAILIDADDLQMRSSDYRTPYPADDVHLGTYGILELGERFANAIFENQK